MENVVAEYPTLTYWVGLTIFILGTLGVVAQKAETLGGVIGGIAKKIKAAKKAAVEEDRNLQGARLEHLEQEFTAFREVTQTRLDRLHKETAEQHSYILYVTSFVRRLEVWAHSTGITLPPPPFLAFDEWKQQQQQQG